MRTALCLAVLIALLPFAPARAEDAAAETWDRVHISGVHAGFVHSRNYTAGEETKRVVSTIVSHVRMNRMGQVIEIDSSSETWETPEGQLLRIASTTKMSAYESQAVYTFENGKLTVETTVMGTTRKVEREVPAELVGPVRAERESHRLAGTTGETYTHTMFSADFESVVTATMSSKGLETVALSNGTSAPLTRVEATIEMADGTPVPMRPLTWMDPAGAPRKTQVETAGMLIETFRVADEATAKAEGEVAAEPDPDVFAQTMISEDDPIPVPRRLEQAWIVVTKRKPETTLPDMSDAGHAVTELPDGSVRIHAVRRTPAADKQGVRPLAAAPEALTDSLAPSSMIQSDAPEIVAIVQQAVGEERCAWKAAQKLETWVFENITKKHMGVAFGSALEACQSREGDCTEHAVLLAALCRAAGIPARVVMGIEYLLGIWGGHAWNEVLIEGEWYPLDATNGLGFVDPLHLPMVHMNMAEGAGGGEMVQLASGIGTVDVDITAVVRDGRKIEVGDASLVTETGGTYVNRVLGISFQAPDGWKLDHPRRRKGMNTKVMEIDGQTAEGAKIEIEIDTMDAPARPDWNALLSQFGIDPESAEPGRVDERDARTMTISRGEKSEIHVAVMADGALWIFRLDRSDDAAGREAFDTFLETVDFDVK